MTESDGSVSTFYDGYGAADFKKGLNERHLFVCNKLVEHGMNDNSSVLELGCGVGIITRLISNKVTSGKIVSSDISPESIEISKSHNKASNIEFDVSDIVNFKREGQSFNFITLFDVMEHVPEQEHEAIFKNLRTLMTEESKVLVHVPTYENIIYSQTAYPERLQIIDQPLKVEDMVTRAAKAGLRLQKMELSNIWHECDYQLFVFGVDKPYTAIEIPQAKRSLLKRAYQKVFGGPF